MGWRRDLRFSGVSRWWLGAIVLGLVSLALGPYREFAAFEVLRMVKVWLMFLVIINECVRVKHFKVAVWALMAGLVVNLAVSLAQFLLKRSLGLEPLGEPSADALAGANYGVFLSAGSVFRVSGLLGHPNLMGAYLALLLPLVLAMMFTDWRAWSKVALSAIFLCGAGILVLTLSRAAWLDFAVAITVLGLVLAFHPELRARHLALKSAVLAAFVVVGIIASVPVLARLTGSDSGATDFRWQWLGIAWDMVKDRPVLGFGLNAFAYHAIDYSPYSVGKMVEIYGNILPAVHNVYMLVWAEQGTLGLLLFLGMQLHVLWLALSNARLRLDDTVHMVSIGCACGMLAVMADGMASFYQRVPAPARIWWIAMALIVAAHYWNRANLPLRRPAAGAAMRR
jgi:O-antigen ligase